MLHLKKKSYTLVLVITFEVQNLFFFISWALGDIQTHTGTCSHSFTPYLTNRSMLGGALSADLTDVLTQALPKMFGFS